MRAALRQRQLPIVALCLGLLLASAPSLRAQLPGAALSSEERDQLYTELVSDFETLSPQLGLLKKLVRLAKPSVVHLEATKEPTRPGRKPSEEAGSGVVIELEGKFYVLTNRHVIDEASLGNISIKLADGRKLRPAQVWSDAETDVAVIAVSESGLTPARIGDSDAIEIGEFVVAVGSPFGLSHSVTYGIISAKGRRDLKLGDGSIFYQDFMQTDAAINPGNSGGPLLDLRGSVIGINTAIASSSGGSEGIGFTIPINMAMTVARHLVQHGRALRAFLGVNLNKDYGPEQAARLGLPRPQGALVKSVIDNSPAADADFKVDDVVLKFDGHAIEDDDHLVKVVGITAVGKSVEVVVFRAGKVVRLTVKLDERRRPPVR